MSVGSFDKGSQHFPADPLADVETDYQFSSDNYSGWLSDQKSTFENASKDLLHRRPMIPHSELNCVRSVRPKPVKAAADASSSPPRRVIPMNRHKLSSIPPKTDPYELVKLVRRGWTLSKVFNQMIFVCSKMMFW